ncbi:ABC transporter permease [Kitasatospora sp. NPDC057223]|uniref:ABC transporter permease n=1 Tax=Kitasatospora sp. NPDC057223 TaxID=3346055 RepID=UPI00362F3B6A
MRRTARTVARRLLLGVLVVWGAATTGFVALHLLPGDPVRLILGTETEVAPEVTAQLKHAYGLDRTTAEQYLSFLGGLLRGDLGTSYQLRRPVTEVLSAELGQTLLLAATALATAFALAVLVATLTAGRRGAGRALASAVELVLISTPVFWLGVLLLTAFSFTWQLFPVAGNDSASSLVLPTLALALPLGALLTQVLRDGLEEALEQPFAVTARTRGLSGTRVRWSHALRHGLLPTVTMAGWLLGGLLGGAVVTESVFSRQGLGRITLQAVNSKDMPVVVGVLVLSATVFVLVNLAVDLLCTVIDPRLRT